MKLFLSSILLFFVSCSGYHLTKRVNPFAQFGVNSISIPMFYNQSSINDVSGYFTREFSSMLYEMKDLEIKRPGAKDVDAYFVGVIRSPRHRIQTLKRGASKEAADAAPVNASGNLTRIPISNSLYLIVDLYLIRRNVNSKNLVTLLRENEIKGLKKGHPGIIFQESIRVSVGISRLIYDGDNAVLNSTNNRGILDKVLREQAVIAANKFKNLVLYVF